jgi:hypothetical protein
VETTPGWYFCYEKGEKRCVKGDERKRERKRIEERERDRKMATSRRNSN